MRIMGVDFGSKRVGVALSDESLSFAFAYGVIKNSSNKSQKPQKRSLEKDKPAGKSADTAAGELAGKSVRSSTLASELVVHSSLFENSLLDEISKIAKENGVTKIVIGESKNFKQEDNITQKEAKLFATQLEEKGFIAIFEPEVLSSVQAQMFQGKNDMLDASAAAIILQSYLDRIKFQQEGASAAHKDCC